MKFNIPEFYRFCDALKVDTKEFGIVSLGSRLMGTQKYFIEQVAQALEEDVHYIVCLKGRQVMVSTICLALDLYWSAKYSGIQGTLITDTEENRDMFRETLTMYMEGLPNEWKQPVVRHNRTQLTFRNRSRFMYQVAGTKKKEKRSVGVGKAVMFMHATECSNWGDEGALADIEASLAQQNPKRLYIFESTARGMNTFMEMWETAQSAATQRAIFVGWWRNDLYSCKKGSPEYNVYWDGRITSQENEWVEDVKKLYDYDISDEQLAWWRWMQSEHVPEESEMMQNYPPTEDYAFQMSGSQFFTAHNLTERMKQARGLAPDCYKILLGQTFEDTELVDSNASAASLKIWEHPKAGAHYAIGADPAWGSSEWADRFCVEVYRVYADGMEQAAEFCTPDCNTSQFAWVMLYLAGAYANTMINLELNGPGMAVWQEILTMKRLAGTASMGSDPKIRNILLNIQNYLYRRPDSIGGGFNYHTKSTTMEKERFMNAYKDGFERGIIRVYSEDCLREMKYVERRDGMLGAPGRGKDDRVIASGLATIAWKDHLQLRLAMIGHTRAQALAARDPSQPLAPLARRVQNYLKAIGMEKVA